jgi:hypothetical protein
MNDATNLFIIWQNMGDTISRHDLELAKDEAVGI